jgi:hypothetical protein
MSQVTLRWETFFSGTHSSYCRRGIVKEFFFKLEHYVFCITITDLRSLTFKVGELNYFAHVPSTDRYRWKENVRGFKKRYQQLSMRHGRAKGSPG